jgi:hypothetical protein
MADNPIRRDMADYEDYRPALRTEVAATYKSMLDELPADRRAAVLDNLVRQEQRRRADAKKAAEAAKVAAEKEAKEMAAQFPQLEPVPFEELTPEERAATPPTSTEHFPMWSDWLDKPLTQENLGAFNNLFKDFVGDGLKKAATEDIRKAILSAAQVKYQAVVFGMYKKQLELEYKALKEDALEKGETPPLPYKETDLTDAFGSWLKVHWPNVESSAIAFSKVLP